MSILINGMEMPQEGFVEVLIRDDGTVQQTGQSYRIDGTDYYTPYVGEMPVMYEAVPVPPHGRLGDLDELAKVVLNWITTQEKAYPNEDSNALSWRLGARAMGHQIFRDIEAAPTIIPAEEGE